MVRSSRPLAASRSLIVSPGIGAGGSGDCHHYFPYPPWLSYAALPCPHGIDGAARGRKFDIYFLLIRIQARFKILCTWIAPRHERVPTIPQRRAPIWRPMPPNRGGAAGVQLKRGQCREKIWKEAFSVCDSRNPLKFHKIAKASFGNVWRKQAQIWKSLEKKAWRVAFVPPPLPPPATPRRRSRSGARCPLGAGLRTGARTGRISTAIASLNRL
jgi:hypothetical protein